MTRHRHLIERDLELVHPRWRQGRRRRRSDHIYESLDWRTQRLTHQREFFWVALPLRHPRFETGRISRAECFEALAPAKQYMSCDHHAGGI